MPERPTACSDPQYQFTPLIVGLGRRQDDECPAGTATAVATMSTGAMGARHLFMLCEPLRESGVDVAVTSSFFTDRASLEIPPDAVELADPSAVVHLESGDEVVVLEGRLEPTTEPGTAGTVAAAYRTKYDIDVAPSGDGPDDVPSSRFTRKVLAWNDGRLGLTTADRWTF